jgi:23S rRNA (cytosine1962-C5)-methyltransferase
MPFSADHFPDYELLDCGNGQKYERFGRLKLIRPETLAIWSPGKKVDEWKKDCDAQFVFDSKGKGHWESKSHVQDWTMFFPLADTKIAFELRLTKFKHMAFFQSMRPTGSISISTQKKAAEYSTCLPTQEEPV